MESMRDEPNIGPALCQFGWQALQPGVWQRSTPRGPVRLERVAQHALWDYYAISSSVLPTVTRGRHLRDNVELAGPAKFVAIGRNVICRCDVPSSLPAGKRTSVSSFDAAPVDAAYWVRSINERVTDVPVAPVEDVDLECVRRLIDETGRTVSRDAARLLIHVQQPGAFCQIRFERDARRCWCFVADLLEVGNTRSRICRAATRLASEANRRLPGVRFVFAGRPQSTLRCEVCFGRTMVPSDWLAAALEAVDTAIALTLRELQALRDPALARLFTAVSTAQPPSGQKGDPHASLVNVTRP